MSCVPRSASSLNSRRLTIDLAMPRRLAAAEILARVGHLHEGLQVSISTAAHLSMTSSGKCSSSSSGWWNTTDGSRLCANDQAPSVAQRRLLPPAYSSERHDAAEEAAATARKRATLRRAHALPGGTSAPHRPRGASLIPPAIGLLRAADIFTSRTTVSRCSPEARLVPRAPRQHVAVAGTELRIYIDEQGFGSGDQFWIEPDRARDLVPQRKARFTLPEHFGERGVAG